jgi:hypothetical protein
MSHLPLIAALKIASLLAVIVVAGGLSRQGADSARTESTPRLAVAALQADAVQAANVSYSGSGLDTVEALFH